jgi:predicted XRE-type DNA-binding protein
VDSSGYHQEMSFFWRQPLEFSVLSPQSGRPHVRSDITRLMAQPRRRKLDLLRSGKGEARYLEIKKSLADELKRRRAARHWTQAEVARALATSQSRFARMEAGDTSVSIDLLLVALLALGATPRDIGRVLAD